MTEEQIEKRAAELRYLAYDPIQLIARLELRLEALEGKGGEKTNIHEAIDKFIAAEKDRGSSEEHLNAMGYAFKEGWFAHKNASK